MNELAAKIVASLPAAAAPAAIFGFAVGAPEVAVFAFMVTLGHALVLGVPVASVLMISGHFKPLPMALAGASVGLVPAAAIFLPLAEPLWTSYARFIGTFSGLGAAGGIAYYYAYRGMMPNPSFKPTPSARLNSRR